MIKGCNIFWSKKIGKCSFVGRHIIVQQEIILRAEHSLTHLMNALQEAIHYSFIKFCIYSLSLWYEFFVHYALKVEKYYQHGLDVGPSEFQFLWRRGCLTNPFRTHFVSGSLVKHQVSSPVIILLKKILSALAIMIMSWQFVIRSSFCSSVKGVEQNVHTTFSFPNPLSESEELQSWGCSKILLSFLMRFNSHF